MVTAGLARTIASRAAVGGGGLAAAGLLGVAVLKAEAEVARRVIGDGPGISHDDTGTYGAGSGDPRYLLVLGDSTAAGVGADDSSTTLGATVAIGVAALSGRPVHVRNVARSGATSPDLLTQVALGLAAMPEAEVAIIMIGSNDVKDRIDIEVAVRQLAQAVTALSIAGVRVVVGTCPDLGTIRPVPQPLRVLAQKWSRDLAAAQTVAVVEAGGRTVSIGDLIGPDFLLSPELFSADRFHPSSAGYARAASAMLPSVLDALGEFTPDTDRSVDYRRGEWVEPLPAAAARAVSDPGSEVSATDVDGSGSSARGRWAKLLRRERPTVPGPDPDPDPDPDVDPDAQADADALGSTAPADAPPDLDEVPDAEASES